MPVYELACGRASAKVRTLGAEICSYQSARGIEYIWPADPAVWGSHSPNLFPTIGILINGQIRIGGKPYEIPKHGIVRWKEFSVHKTDDSSIELVYEADEWSKALYPFVFSLSIRHTIREDGFTTCYTVENRDKGNMPFTIGGHPGFLCPLYKGEAFEDYVIRFEQDESGWISILSDEGRIIGQKHIALREKRILPLCHDLFNQDALIFDKLTSRRVLLENPRTGKGIEFSYADFDVLALWTKPGVKAPYICLEPWNGLPPAEGETGRFEDKPHVCWLKPGEMYQAEFSARVME